MKRVAIILAGGIGERFWPLSRRDLPKQLLPLGPGGRSLLRLALERSLEFVKAENIHVVTGEPLAERIQPHVLPKMTVLAEPAKRNTGGAIAWAMAHLEEDAVVGLFPADHHIEGNFETTMSAAYGYAESTGDIVTIGIKPTRPDTGFGYIEVDGPPAPNEAQPAMRFHEKPTIDVVESYVASGKHFWNSGMFFMTRATFERELALADPSYFEIYQQMRTAPEAFKNLPSISIDHLIAERSGRVSMIEADFTWDDVGSLDAFAQFVAPDEAGNRIEGDAVMVNASGNFVVNQGTDTVVALVGVDDLIVTVTADAVLVTRKNASEDLREVVAELDRRDAPQV